ncbi:HYC_CC_PP family protein [Lutimonas saemankumensis]
MKEVFHKIMSVCMAVVVLFSTTSFTMHMHYCGDTLVDKSYFVKAESCGMETPQPEESSDCETVKKDCCSEDQLTVEGQDELKRSHELSLKQQVFVATFVQTHLYLFESAEKSPDFGKHYLPPPLIKSIYKLDEVYLI